MHKPTTDGMQEYTIYISQAEENNVSAISNIKLQAYKTYDELYTGKVILRNRREHNYLNWWGKDLFFLAYMVNINIGTQVSVQISLLFNTISIKKRNR
jgi:hypothetical protein